MLFTSTTELCGTLLCELVTVSILQLCCTSLMQCLLNVQLHRHHTCFTRIRERTTQLFGWWFRRILCILRSVLCTICRKCDAHIPITQIRLYAALYHLQFLLTEFGLLTQYLTHQEFNSLLHFLRLLLWFQKQSTWWTTCVFLIFNLCEEMSNYVVLYFLLALLEGMVFY